MGAATVLAAVVALSTMAGAGDVIWEFSDSPPPGNIAWAPADWIRTGDGGFWTFPRSGVSAVQPLGLTDGALTFIRSTAGSQEIEADIYTPPFRFSDLATAALEFLELDFDEAALYVADKIEISLHREDQTDVGPITSITPALGSAPPVTIVVDAARLNSLFSDKLDTQSFYRIRLRASDKDDVFAIPNAFLGDLVIRSGALKPAGNPDYNRDANVDGADFLVWQREWGATGASSADGNADGAVNWADMVVWQDNFGRILPRSIPAAAPIPEPSALYGLAMACWALGLLRRHGSRDR